MISPNCVEFLRLSDLLRVVALIFLLKLCLFDNEQTVLAGETQETASSATTQVSTSTTSTMLSEMERDIDPTQTGWDTEVFAQQGSSQLKYVGKYFLSVVGGKAEPPVKFLADEFECTSLQPNSLVERFADASTTVRTSSEFPQDPKFSGEQGFFQSTRGLLDELTGATDARFKFKLFRVEPTDDHIKTTVYFEISGLTETGALQINATWQCHWSKSTEKAPPKLLWIGVTDYEEVEIRHAAKHLFSDYTNSVLLTPEVQEQFSRGIDYWRSHLELYMRIYWDGHHGLSIADVNGDGLDDLYVCEPGGLPNRLLVQQPSGTLKDVSAESGIDFLEYVRSALFIDIDNDGDQDAVIPSTGRFDLFSNDGTGTFTLRATIRTEGKTAYSLAAADYNADGDIDFYACFYRGVGVDESKRLASPLPYHDARTGGKNHLFRNDGNWDFVDATSEVGLDHNNDRWSYSATWEDFDNDGDLDLYVANDFGRNNFYRNDEGRFSDVAGPAGAEDVNFGMSASVGDYDRDGLMDVYISNMFSAAGGRVTFQPQFKTDKSDELKAAYRQMSRGNTLLRNRGDGTFDDVSAAAGVTTGRWAWTSLFADLNNDGWEDLVVANGFVTGKLTHDL